MNIEKVNSYYHEEWVADRTGENFNFYYATVSYCN